MGQRFTEMSERHIDFIRRQKLFFVGTATADSRVNISPKGMDSLRVIDARRVAWLNVTGSGNETAAHVQHNPRMTILFCAFEGAPLILRLYGSATAIHRDSPRWAAMQALFPPLSGARQIFDMQVDLGQSSCGMAVPHFNYDKDRTLLRDWADRQGEAGIRAYWAEKNRFSLDGVPTHIVERED